MLKHREAEIAFLLQQGTQVNYYLVCLHQIDGNTAKNGIKGTKILIFFSLFLSFQN